MTLDEAIKHCEEIAQDNENLSHTLWDNKEKARCEDCAKEHRQLAEWLKELKKYRAIFEKVGKILADNGYTIDDLDTIFGKANGEEEKADEDSN